MKIKEASQSRMVIKNGFFVQAFVAGLVFLFAIISLFATGFGPVTTRLIISAVLILIAGGFFLLIKVKTFTFDKSANLFLIESRSVFGKKNQQFPLANIVQIEVSEHTYTETSGTGQNRRTQTKTQYSSVIKLKAGELIQLDRDTSSVSSFGLGFFAPKNKCRVVSQQIADFIGVPCIDKGAPTAGDLVSAIKTTVSQASSFADGARPGAQPPEQNPLAPSSPEIPVDTPLLPVSPPAQPLEESPIITESPPGNNQPPQV